MKCPVSNWVDVDYLMTKNEIPYQRGFAGFRNDKYDVRPSDFQRARALIAEQFKDNPEIIKGLAPESTTEN